MNSGAKKFSFKMKEVESIVNKDSIAPGVLKFHNALAEVAPLKIVEKSSVSPEEKVNKRDFLTLKGTDEAKEVKRKRFNTDNYFGVKNHIDLFETGKHYSELQKAGLKSLAFYGAKASTSVHHSILGLASFFNYHRNIKATIFIDKFQGSEISKYVKPTHVEVEVVDIENEEDLYEVYACDGIEIVELDKLKHLAYKIGPEAFSEFISKIVKRSDVAFWDLPASSVIDKERELYIPIINVIDSLTLIIDSGVTKRNEINDTYRMAGKYQIQVEGVLLYKNQTTKRA